MFGGQCSVFTPLVRLEELDQVVELLVVQVESRGHGC